MKPKVTKFIIFIVLLLVLIGSGVGLYFYLNQGPIVGSIQYGAYYHLTSIRPTDRFAGATMSHDSYFRIKTGGKTGELYLKDLTATSGAPIPFVVTNYKEGHQHTVIEFEYIINEGEKTKIQHLTAISTKNEIRIKTVETHQANVIQQNANAINSLEYEVTILVFSLDEEAA